MASLITVDELNAFSGDNEATAEAAALKTSICAAASSIVTNYLGYEPASATRYFRTVGTGDDYIRLPIPAVTSITSITEDGVTLAATKYSLVLADTKYNVERSDGCIFLRAAKIVVTYVAGYATTPDIIKHTALRIAGLMLAEAHGNIGVTSKSFADVNRTFVNLTNYAKYLSPLSQYQAGAL